MKIEVAISVLPEARQVFESDAVSTIEAIREVLGREMIAESLARHKKASLVISAMVKPKPTGGYEHE